MKTLLLIFGVLFLLWTLYGFKSYFKSAKKLNDTLRESREKTKREGHENVFAGVLLGAIALTVIISVIWIAYMVAVAFFFGHGWVTVTASIFAAVTAIFLIPDTLRMMSMTIKRDIGWWVLPPAKTIFLAYIVWVLAR